jgi:hypothetical protein
VLDDVAEVFAEQGAEILYSDLDYVDSNDKVIRMVHNCVVHIPVKANGKKCKTTFLPLKSERDTSFFSDDTKVNCGAG